MLLDFYAELFVRRRWIVALFIVLVTLLATWGYLRESRSPLKTRSEVNEQQQGFDTPSEEPVESEETEVSEALLVVQADDFFTPRRMEAMRAMVDAIESLPSVDSVVWIDRIPVTNMFGVGKPLIPPNGSQPERFQQSKKRVLDHPLAVGQLISEDGATILMPIVIDWLNVESDQDCTTRIVDAARESLSAVGAEDIQVRLTGDVPLFVAQTEALHRSQRKFQVIGYVLALVVTIALFRGVSAVLIVSSAPAIAIYWSLGLLNLLDHSTNTLTNVILPVLVSMIGLTDGVHLMMHIRERRAKGSSQTEAAKFAVQKVGLACALTSITTFIGFGSLTVASAQFIRDFGEACAIGVVVSFCAVVTIIPLLSCTWLGRRVHEGHSSDLISRQLRGSLPFVNAIMDRPRFVTVIAVLLTTLFAGISLTLRPDNVTKHSLPTGSEMYDALVHCDESMGGIDTAQVEIRWPANLAADNPRIYRVVEQTQRLLEKEPSLRHPLSLCDVMETFPESEADSATRLSMLELLPPPLKRLFVDGPSRKALISFRIRDDGIAKYEPVFRNVENEFAEIMAENPGFEIKLIGEPVIRSRDLYQVVLDLAKSLGVASVVIFLVITIVYRSLRLGLISIVPNLFPLVFTGTVLVAMGGALDFASVCAFTVCLGIAVDDTIHFLTRFQQSRHLPLREAIRSTYLGVGTALVTTTVILVLGFGATMTSELPDHRMFASMACATIAAALAGDLIFLPALLVCFPGKKDRQQPQANLATSTRSAEFSNADRVG